LFCQFDILNDFAVEDEGRIVGGSEVEPNSIPYQAAIFFDVGDSGYFCGGSLISELFFNKFHFWHILFEGR
jgi:secreted trypsin-like serine protease